MVRITTQILAGLMLLFGVATLFPKAIIEYKAGRKMKGIVSAFLGVLAFFFSFLAFYYAYLEFTNK